MDDLAMSRATYLERWGMTEYTYLKRLTAAREYKRRLYRARKRSGICTLCYADPAKLGHVMCGPCLEYQRMMWHERRKA